MTSPSDDLLDDDQICNLSSVSCENENENENDDDDGEEDTRGILKPASGRPLNRRIASGYESHSSDIESAMEEGAPRSNSNSNSHKFVSFQGDMESVESSSRETAARDTTNTTAGTGMSAASRPSRRALLQNTKKQSSRVLLSPQGRFSQTIDLETGKVGGGRAQCAVVRCSLRRKNIWWCSLLSLGFVLDLCSCSISIYFLTINFLYSLFVVAVPVLFIFYI